VAERKLRRGFTVFSEEQRQAVARRLHLSPRELEIVHGIFDNFKENRIAERMAAKHENEPPTRSPVQRAGTNRTR